ncbi:hypothetical protein Ptr902_10137 [Pyrenophora tritici-repentis]|uniref:Uncharacterized protein n=2 Tax=Pyrenophora tritici-repentis TaxID=45151 RepID=A0A316ZT80_9PLEO|nr:uncharacterized protein PTRG_06439 [Pyrenophora tritici-repentis Pt-1C-BFP]KAA8613511.1 hypothetical protein PtrV1_12419 [Pyrenophora tritici-repentis]EDU49359.1 hypothetical protein PTRG_06439 [Pyrenophora tritici-repentis Pt-1C-BFP]KAF7445223.1 hypothetical protein A1F99_102090 [Pyrenophora tritici-repentis]KAF7565488.1 hypothetical protein PtrM4_049220 [Pyrenophora tritici-repentis]KAI0584686.1 hypothetical protein Alg215_02923 [Pyrenophora tritici-repentis]
MNNITGNASTSNDTSMSGVQQGQGQREDYLDKGLDAAEKKWGGSAGQNTEKNRGVNEKITDSASSMFEKATGKDVPDKVSN